MVGLEIAPEGSILAFRGCTKPSDEGPDSSFTIINRRLSINKSVRCVGDCSVEMTVVRIFGLRTRAESSWPGRQDPQARGLTRHPGSGLELRRIYTKPLLTLGNIDERRL